MTTDRHLYARRHRGRLRVAATLAVLAVAVLFGLPAVPDPSSAGTSAMPWLSGVSVNTAADAARWAQFRGRPVGVAQTYTDRDDGWDPLVDPTYLWSAMNGYGGTVVISQPFWPENYDHPENLSRCGEGYYYTQWKRFGASMVAGGRAAAIVRLAWEANGTWFPWQASDTADWKRCFQNTVRAIRATDPKARIEWAINGHYSLLPTTTHNPYDLYPGDAYVDIVGMSAYDHYPPSRNQSEWDAQFKGPGGLDPLIRFATAHKKKFAVSEWGVAATNLGGGGDNPFYVQQMFNVFSFFRASLAYEAYFDDADPTNVMSSLTTPGLNPNAAALYRRLWGSVT